jgi:hypothetical protein
MEAEKRGEEIEVENLIGASGRALTWTGSGSSRLFWQRYGEILAFISGLGHGAYFRHPGHEMDGNGGIEGHIYAIRLCLRPSFEAASM